MADLNVPSPNTPAKVRYFSPQLIKKLSGISNDPVTVLEAPSGYGKTTALLNYLKDSSLRDMSVYGGAPKKTPRRHLGSDCVIY